MRSARFAKALNWPRGFKALTWPALFHKRRALVRAQSRASRERFLSIIEPERQPHADEDHDGRDDRRMRNGLAEQQRAERDRHHRIHIHATARDDRARVPYQETVGD